MNKILNIEIIYASKETQVILPLSVVSGTTLKEAILLSGILEKFPEINLAEQKIGVYGKRRDYHDLVQDGDRIEIHRPLTIDPKAARRAKAKITRK